MVIFTMDSVMPLFKVIRASAGSGKTFNLTREYLRLLFSEGDAFMHILAVTFTNKATEEMKSRILIELYLLSTDQPSKQLDGLMSATALSEKQIRIKAAAILKKLLHNYSKFSVTTIDSFFQRIIRSFTRELGIQEGYSIELDTDLVLTEIIERLLILAEEDKMLLSWLTQFAEYLIDRGESWNIRKGIFNLGREIFKEEFKSLNQASLKLFSDREFLNNYRSVLHKLITSIETQYKEFGLKAEKIIADHGLAVDDFYRKDKGPAGFLVKLKSGYFTAPTATAREAINSVQKWHTAMSPLKNQIQQVASLLIPVLEQVIQFYDFKSMSYLTSQVILKNLYTLGILIDLSQLADTWCSENNAFLLPEAPVFLNKIIDGNDTPFIYEKAGCWYHHFMIDEFQDTSLMQWLNFKPLISNSLSQGFDNLAVGDTKQSIYRWRNSNWEILETRVSNDFLPGVIDSLTLKENWRSGTKIIEFNNSFFQSASNILQNAFDELVNANNSVSAPAQSITGLYAGLEQRPGKPDQPEGYVQVDYISCGEEASYSEEVNQKVIDLIYSLLELGYRLNDIAILTRKNSEATELADFILEYGQKNKSRRIDVISDEALHLGSSVVLNTIIALMRFLTDPLDITNNYFLSTLCTNYVFEGDPDVNWINPYKKENSLKLPEEFAELADSGKSFSLVEITESIIKIFRLEKHAGESVYLMAFRDLVIEYSAKTGSDLLRFLEFWDETGNTRSVSAPSGQEAIRIMTLHKSKGLEFKVTIIPYCTWELNSYNKSFIWCKPTEEPFNKLPLLPLSFTTQLQETLFAEDYYQEIHKQYIDNLNLLYVAFTRAREGLFIFCRNSEKDQLKTVSDLSRKVLGNGLFKAGLLAGSHDIQTDFGVNDTGKKEIEYIDLKKITGRMKIAFQGELHIDPDVNRPSRPLNEGKILHDIFRLILVRDDIPSAIGRLHLQGKIASEDQEKYIRLISHAMNDLQVSTWFTGDWTVINEAEIILPAAVIKRPDRVMIKDNQTLVIDYKFGSKIEPAYEKQVKEYAELLISMGYKNVEAYIWYLKLARVVQVNLMS